MKVIAQSTRAHIPRVSVRSVLIVCAALVCSFAAAQSKYPAAPVRLVIPSAAGGPTDVAGRVIAQKLSELWEQPVVADNRTSANGVVGSEIVAKAKPDGYTLLVGNSGTHVMNVGLYRRLPYDPINDFTPIAKMVVSPIVLMSNASLPVTDVRGLIEYSKGHPLFFASAGGTGMMASLMFNSLAGTNIELVPYKGGTPADLSVISNETQATFTALLNARGHVSSGRVRMLAVTSAAPLPGVPTLNDSGLKGYELEFWTGLFAPAGTPRPVVEKISQDIGKVLRDPDTLKRLDDAGFSIAYLPTNSFSDLLKASTTKYKKLMAELGIKPE